MASIIEINVFLIYYLFGYPIGGKYAKIQM